MCGWTSARFTSPSRRMSKETGKNAGCVDARCVRRTIENQFEARWIVRLQADFLSRRTFKSHRPICSVAWFLAIHLTTLPREIPCSCINYNTFTAVFLPRRILFCSLLCQAMIISSQIILAKILTRDILHVKTHRRHIYMFDAIIFNERMEYLAQVAFKFMLSDYPAICNQRLIITKL